MAFNGDSFLNQSWLPLLGRERNLDGTCLFAAQGQMIVAHEDPDRVAQRGAIHDEHSRAGNDSHLHKSEPASAGGVHREDPGAYLCWHGVKCHV